MRLLRRSLPVLVVVFAALASPAAGQAPRPSTPELIERAHGRGEIGGHRANLLRAYAFRSTDRLPARFRSTTPWDGTLVLLRLHRTLERMPPGRARQELREALEPTTRAAADCGGEPNSSLTSSTQTAHFLVEYGSIGGGRTLADYTAALETTWDTHITSFGWGAPPLSAPGSRYHVQIAPLGSGLYGFASSSGTYAGFLGDNPSTPWDEGDALRSCLVLNNDYSSLGGLAGLQATVAHEFHHAVQFGLGVLDGTEPDDSYVEGGATWVEDEVFDDANDNYFFLWPTLADSMGDYDGNPYGYWLTWRGLTERFGTGVADGGEEVMQRFWELTSREEARGLTAMDQALAAEGTTLADAFHAYAIAARFAKACTGGYALPYCFEEAGAYLGAAPSHGASVANAAAITSTTQSTPALSVEDNFAARYVALPTGTGAYSVSLSNLGSGALGRLRGTVVCDTGAELTRHPLPAAALSGESRTLASFDPAGCAGAVLVVTNETKTADDPATSGLRSFSVTTAAPGVTLYDLQVTREGGGTVTSSPAGIDCGSDCAGTFGEGTVVTLAATPAAGSTFTGWSGACAGSAATCDVTMDGARAVTATFAALPPDDAPSDTGAGTEPPAQTSTETTQVTPPATDEPRVPSPVLEPVADLAAPRMMISRRPLRVSRRGRLALRLRCPASEPAGCSGVARLVLRRSRRASGARGARRVVLGRARFSIAGGATKRVRMRVTRRARRLLRRSGRLRTLVVVRARDAAGNRRTARRRIVLVR